MEKQNEEEKIERINIIREKTIEKQFREIYLDQKNRRKTQKKRDLFLKKWGCIFACCLS